MSWPDFESGIPAPLRGGPLPPDVQARAWSQLREGWRKQVARRVHGAEERAIGLVALPPDAAPFALVFDGRTCEAAVPQTERAARELAELPPTGMVMRQGATVLWRESLSADQAASRWRALGGDEAFSLQPALPGHGLRAYALVRRGQDRAHVDLSGLALPANAPIRAWAERFKPFLRADLRAALFD